MKRLNTTVLAHPTSTLKRWTACHLVDRPEVRGATLRRVHLHAFVRQELLQLRRFVMDSL